MGNYTNEIANAGTCYATEQRSVWFTWTVQQSGLLRFEIDPINNNQDHDWTLFNLTNASCAQLSTSTGASSAMSRSNTWGVNGNNGSTGISTTNGGTGTCNGPGTGNGPKWCADLSVTAGQRYALHVTNWTGSAYGFFLDFTASTAVLYDNVPPEMDSIVSPIECNSFDSLTIRFSENIVCDSTETGDFTLIGPGGPHTITSVSSPVCSVNGAYDLEYTFHFSPPVTQIGEYVFKIIPGDGFIEDLCGNLDTLDSIVFNYTGEVTTALFGVDPLCNGDCTGSIDLNINSGQPPFSMAWNNGLSADSSHSNVCAGTYIVTVTDDIDCERVDTIVIDEPPVLLAAIDSVSMVSCPFSTSCDAQGYGSASGGVPPYGYLWQSGETNAESIQLCSGSNDLIVTDAHGCVDTANATVQVPQPIQTTGFGDTTICISNFAGISAASTGGTAPYTYVWTQGSLAGSVVSTSAGTSVDPSTTTKYFVRSTDQNGCQGDTSRVTISVRPPLSAEIDELDTICPGDLQTIIAQGQGGDEIYSYAWSSGGFGPETSVSPAQSTWYYVTVSDYCGTPAFVDSVFQQVGGYPNIRAEIEAEDDSLCPGESVYLIARGYGGHMGPDEFRFRWSHVADSNRIQFVRPPKSKQYIVTISDLCLSKPGIDTLWVRVDDIETPSLNFYPNEHCGEALVEIGFDSPRSGYEYTIDLGDGYVLNDYADSSILHKYTNPGCYDVEVEVISDFMCKATVEFPCAVRIKEAPNAAFTHNPLELNDLDPFMDFVNISTGYNSVEWRFNYNRVFDRDSLQYEFINPQDSVTVALMVTSIDGCVDTVTKHIIVDHQTTIFYPSSFSPNDDGINDQFGITGEFIQWQDFELVIYDRWGQQVFRSDRPDRMWDGKTPTGDRLPAGSYPWTLRYRDASGELKVLVDHVVISKAGDKIGL